MTLNNVEIILTGIDALPQAELEAYIQRGKEAEPKKDLSKIDNF